MKRLLLFLYVTLLSTIGFAQESGGDSLKGVIYKDIPIKLNIKDKIILENKTPYLILQSVVAIADKDGKFIPLASTPLVSPNETWEMASYKNNGLKQLRGQRIAIKVKGSKKIVSTNSTSVNTPYGSVGVQHKDLDSEVLNNIKPEDIIYDFDVVLYEANHDLYIQIMYKGENGKSIMDF